MAATVSSAATTDHHHHLHTESLPLIDLRFLSQSELLSLSLCSSFLNNNRQNEADVATLKIDRSVFNESAGSRKQTFSKLRLAPRNSSSHFPSTPSIRTLKNFDFPQDEESSQIICLVKALFGSNFNSIESDDVDCKKNLASDVDDDYNLISVPITYNESFQALQNLAAAKNYREETKRAIATAIADSSGNKKRKRGRPRCSSSNNVSVNENEERKDIVVEEEDQVSVASDSKRKRGRPRKDWSNNVNVSEESQVIVVGKEENVVPDTQRKKGGEWKNLSSSDVNVNVNEESEIIVVEEEKENVVTNSKSKQGGNVSENVNTSKVIVVEESGGVKVEASGGVEDWYGEELRRRTMGMQTEEEVLGFLDGLEGEWMSKRKKRKIVDVSVLGDVLPKGWKLIVCNKRRAGYYWLDCSGYIRFLTNFIQDFIACDCRFI